MSTINNYKRVHADVMVQLLPIEPFQRGRGFDQIFLRFPSSVKNRTVSRRAQDVLVQRTLTSLTLRPQTVEVFLELVYRG